MKVKYPFNYHNVARAKLSQYACLRMWKNCRDQIKNAVPICCCWSEEGNDIAVGVTLRHLLNALGLAGPDNASPFLSLCELRFPKRRRSRIMQGFQNSLQR